MEPTFEVMSAIASHRWIVSFIGVNLATDQHRPHPSTGASMKFDIHFFNGQLLKNIFFGLRDSRTANSAHFGWTVQQKLTIITTNHQFTLISPYLQWNLCWLSLSNRRLPMLLHNFINFPRKSPESLAPNLFGSNLNIGKATLSRRTSSKFLIQTVHTPRNSCT